MDQLRQMEPGRRYAAIGIVAGAIFAIMGIAGASGGAFAVVAIAVGIIFALLAVLGPRGGS